MRGESLAALMKLARFFASVLAYRAYIIAPILERRTLSPRGPSPRRDLEGRHCLTHPCGAVPGTGCRECLRGERHFPLPGLSPQAWLTNWGG